MRRCSLLMIALVLAGCPEEPEPTPAPEPTPEPTPAGPPPLASGLEIAAVTLNQGVEVRLARSFGVLESPSAPVVADRGGLLRVLVSPTDDWEEREVEATLRLEGLDVSQGDDDDSADVDLTTWVDARVISDFSDVADIDSTFNFELPPEAIQVGVTWSVELREVEHGAYEGSTERARLPAEGTARLHASDWGGVVRIELIPVQYAADGSNRVPSVDDERVAVYRSWFERLYPVREVDLTVGEVYVSDMEILADGTGMSEHLELMSDIREERGIPWDRYVYGLLTPAPEDAREAWCAGGCTLGLSYRVRNPNSDRLRVSVGTSFEAERSSRTMLHEVGHAHDRGHADCGGASNTDEGFPYGGGSIGSWGWDLIERTLVDPAEHADLMSYCSPWWFSDYTYEALWDRIAMLEGIGAARGEPEPWRVVSVRPDGTMATKGVRQMADVPGEVRAVTVERADGSTARVEGRFWPLNHLDGGTLLVPDPHGDVVRVR